MSLPTQVGGGEIVYAGPTRRTATSFDDVHVIGPAVQLTRNADGTWSGWLAGRAVQLEAHGGRIDGASLSVRIEERDDGVEIRGHWSSARGADEGFSLRVTREELYARGATGTKSLLLKARGEGSYGASVFGDFAVRLFGQAAQTHPPEPQFALALLGALSG